MKIRSLLTILFLGSIWGFLEATLGGLMHMFELPMTGMLMATVGFTLLHFALKNGVKASHLAYISLIAASFKWFDVVLFSLSPLDRHIVNPAAAIACMGLAASFFYAMNLHRNQHLNRVLQTGAAVLTYFVGFNLISSGVFGYTSGHMTNPLQSLALNLILVPLFTALLVALLSQIRVKVEWIRIPAVQISLAVVLTILSVAARLYLG